MARFAPLTCTDSSEVNTQSGVNAAIFVAAQSHRGTGLLAANSGLRGRADALGGDTRGNDLDPLATAQRQ
jgi:hypothetical protein